MQVPKISVVLPCYNGQETISAAVRSVLQQTFEDFECIVVNDGSTDNSSALLRELGVTDARLRIIDRRENRGLPFTLNEGIVQAQGDLIARLDADDEAYPQRLEQQFRFMQEHPEIDVLGSGAMFVYRDGGEHPVYLPLHHAELCASIYRRNPFIHPTVVFRRSFILRAGGYQEWRRCEDADLWLRCYKWAGYANLPALLLRYSCQQKDSLGDLITKFRMLAVNASREGKISPWRQIARVVIFYSLSGLLSPRQQRRRWERRYGSPLA